MSRRALARSGNWQPNWVVQGFNRSLTQEEDAILGAWSRAEGPNFLAQSGATLPPSEIDSTVVEAALFGLVQTQTGDPLVVGHRGAFLPPGTRVKGRLDLSALEFRRPIQFENCYFDGAIILNQAKLGPLSLKGSEFPSLRGSGAHILGDLDLRNITTTSLGVPNICIEGDLSLDDAILNPNNESLQNNTCLNCGSAEIKSSVFLRAGFTANGEVRFAGTRIGGQLSCVGGTFKHENAKALNCDAVSITGSVFLRDGFSSFGEANLVRAKIGGHLDCGRAAFINPDGCALNCDAAEIGASVFLRFGFKAIGQVNFVRAKIAGNFQLRRASIDCGKDPCSIDLEGATIESTLFFTHIDESCGLIDLREASVRSFAEDTSIWARKGVLPIALRRRPKTRFHLDGFKYERFTDLYEEESRTPTDGATRVAWLQTQAQRDLVDSFRPQPWVHCAKVLREMGHDRDALQVSRAREWQRLKSDPLTWRDFKNPLRGSITLISRLLGNFARWLFGHVAGFGYAHWRAFGVSLCVVLIGAFFYMSAFDKGLLIRDPESNFEGGIPRSHVPSEIEPGPRAYPAFNAFVYSLDMFIPVVDLRQAKYWVPGTNQRPGEAQTVSLSWLSRTFGFGTALMTTLTALAQRVVDLSTFGGLLWLWTWFEIAAGWVMSAILIAGFTGLLDRRE